MLVYQRVFLVGCVADIPSATVFPAFFPHFFCGKTSAHPVTPTFILGGGTVVFQVALKWGVQQFIGISMAS